MIEVSYKCEVSETEPTKILGAAPDPERPLNASIKTRLTEAPTIKLKLKVWLCIVDSLLF